jgi:hypothetical protein
VGAALPPLPTPALGSVARKSRQSDATQETEISNFCAIFFLREDQSAKYCMKLNSKSLKETKTVDVKLGRTGSVNGHILNPVDSTWDENKMDN